MAKITVLGGTGYTGGNIVREALAQGHEVVSYSRRLPDTPLEGVQYKTGSLLDDAVRQQAVQGSDVVIGALSPRGELESTIAGVYTRIAEIAAEKSARLGVIGGFSTLRPAEGAPRFVEKGDIPPEFAAEAQAMYAVLENLLTRAPAGLDWFYASPAASYGAHVPGTATGTYRTSGDVALFDNTGTSAISGPDFALAVVTEVGTPSHHRAQFSVAY